MILTPQNPDSRSSAHPLRRFARALKRALRFSETQFSPARAHPPIPPRGGRLSAARASLERARTSAQARIDRLGTPGPIQAGDARGNSTRWGQTFFRLSCPVVRIARVESLPGLAPPVGIQAPWPHGPTRYAIGPPNKILRGHGWPRFTPHARRHTP